MTRRVRGDDGATAVEFALVFPVFMALLALALWFAWWMVAEAQLQHAANRAARMAAVPTSTGDYEFDRVDVLDEVNDRMVILSVADADLELRDNVGPAADGRAPKDVVRVKLTTRFINPFGFIAGAFVDGADSTIDITAVSEARVEAAP